MASLAEKAAQRELEVSLSNDSSIFAGSSLVYAVSRAARLSCLALSEELLYRSVLYAYIGYLMETFVSSDPASSLAVRTRLGNRHDSFNSGDASDTSLVFYSPAADLNWRRR